jgi:hypothetical protein
MDDILCGNFMFVHRTLPNGTAQCEGFGQPTWITKSVTLSNDTWHDVAKGIYHSVNANFVVYSDGQPLDNDQVAIQIADSLSKEDLPLEWMFFMRVWHIVQVFLNVRCKSIWSQTTLYL